MTKNNIREVPGDPTANRTARNMIPNIVRKNSAICLFL